MEARPRIFLHVCCAPCLSGVIPALEGEGISFSGWFYNPNIHPLLEFRKRIKALRVLQSRLGFEIAIDDNYGLEPFLNLLAGRWGRDRCELCYAHRLNAAAKRAAGQGFGSFSTTLLISTEQNHEMIASYGQQAARSAGIEFLYRDFRPFRDRGRELARKANLYRQQYCGCIFSECERYINSPEELYRGATGPVSE
ncbi:MAG: epoxyqueuosine reductase QueH [Candidatus Brocadiia bacterium]